jgi:hypothetical protein
MRENVEGCRRTTSVGKIKKQLHDKSLFILEFEWEIIWACIRDGRNKASENLHERGFFMGLRRKRAPLLKK